MELLQDADFQRGLLLSKLKSSEPDPFNGGKLTFFRPEEEPVCVLAQWFSTEDLAKVEPERTEHSVACVGRCKQVAYTAEPGKSPCLSLTCDCLEEYGGPAPSPDFYGWVHMGISQPLKEAVRLESLKGLDMRMRVRFTAEDKAEGVPPSQHTAQFNVCFILQNRNPQSPDHNKIIWNQICLFDSREPLPGEYCGVDDGVAECSGEFIYTMDSREMLQEPMGDGRERLLQYDWLPEMKMALAKVQERGGMAHTRWEDLWATDFSYGFEVARGIILKLDVSDIHVDARM